MAEKPVEGPLSGQARELAAANSERSQRLWHTLVAWLVIAGTIALSTIVARWLHPAS